MNCYRCKSTEDLTLKRTLKSGHMLFMCKACRHDEYSKRRGEIIHQDNQTYDMKGWREMVKAKHHRIAMKYRDEDFMRARGLIV